tara:strand:+ start:1672 stop:2349 length:678 start_codon:yes stop_codon:yes gene_type:complete
MNIFKNFTQSMYDAETNFNLLMTSERLSKFLVHYEAFKKIQNISGSIVEAGVFKGTSFSRFSMLRKIFRKESSKLIGFDVFEEPYPNTKYSNEKKQREHWIKTAGGVSISKKNLEKILKKKGIKNFELIKGDVLKTIPKFKKRKKVKIALLNVDIDFVESTECVLYNLYDNIVKGGIILLDNYKGIGTSGIYYKGETRIINKFLKKIKRKPLSFKNLSKPMYIIK